MSSEKPEAKPPKGPSPTEFQELYKKFDAKVDYNQRIKELNEYSLDEMIVYNLHVRPVPNEYVRYNYETFLFFHNAKFGFPNLGIEMFNIYKENTTVDSYLKRIIDSKIYNCYEKIYKKDSNMYVFCQWINSIAKDGKFGIIFNNETFNDEEYSGFKFDYMKKVFTSFIYKNKEYKPDIENLIVKAGLPKVDLTLKPSYNISLQDFIGWKLLSNTKKSPFASNRSLLNMVSMVIDEIKSVKSKDQISPRQYYFVLHILQRIIISASKVQSNDLSDAITNFFNSQVTSNEEIQGLMTLLKLEFINIIGIYTQERETFMKALVNFYINRDFRRNQLNFAEPIKISNEIEDFKWYKSVCKYSACCFFLDMFQKEKSYEAISFLTFLYQKLNEKPFIDKLLFFDFSVVPEIEKIAADIFSEEMKEYPLYKDIKNVKKRFNSNIRYLSKESFEIINECLLFTSNMMPVRVPNSSGVNFTFGDWRIDFKNMANYDYDFRSISKSFDTISGIDSDMKMDILKKLAENYTSVDNLKHFQANIVDVMMSADNENQEKLIGHFTLSHITDLVLQCDASDLFQEYINNEHPEAAKQTNKKPSKSSKTNKIKEEKPKTPIPKEKKPTISVFDVKKQKMSFLELKDQTAYIIGGDEFKVIDLQEKKQTNDNDNNEDESGVYRGLSIKKKEKKQKKQNNPVVEEVKQEIKPVQNGWAKLSLKPKKKKEEEVIEVYSKQSKPDVKPFIEAVSKKNIGWGDLDLKGNVQQTKIVKHEEIEPKIEEKIEENEPKQPEKEIVYGGITLKSSKKSKKQNKNKQKQEEPKQIVKNEFKPEKIEQKLVDFNPIKLDDTKSVDSQQSDSQETKSIDTNSVDSQEMKSIDSQETKSIDTNSVDSQETKSIDTNSVDSQETKSIDTNSVDSQEMKSVDSQEMKSVDSQEMKSVDANENEMNQSDSSQNEIVEMMENNDNYQEENKDNDYSYNYPEEMTNYDDQLQSFPSIIGNSNQYFDQPQSVQETNQQNTFMNSYPDQINSFPSVLNSNSSNSQSFPSVIETNQSSQLNQNLYYNGLDHLFCEKIGNATVSNFSQICINVSHVMDIQVTPFEISIHYIDLTGEVPFVKVTDELMNSVKWLYKDNFITFYINFNNNEPGQHLLQGSISINDLVFPFQFIYTIFETVCYIKISDLNFYIDQNFRPTSYVKYASPNDTFMVSVYDSNFNKLDHKIDLYGEKLPMLLKNEKSDTQICLSGSSNFAMVVYISKQPNKNFYTGIQFNLTFSPNVMSQNLIPNNFDVIKFSRSEISVLNSNDLDMTPRNTVAFDIGYHNFYNLMNSFNINRYQYITYDNAPSLCLTLPYLIYSNTINKETIGFFFNSLTSLYNQSKNNPQMKMFNDSYELMIEFISNQYQMKNFDVDKIFKNSSPSLDENDQQMSNQYQFYSGQNQYQY
ncbi:hypothetical protein TVAG_408340 [Trichomonas vaginalis G3]|uniref:Uncharacterized protein n=1 Tax=Trichomonas vaginalis (strain ATCC PRA-98 / G3) TaxID=412133 RepID=A2F6N6_TRIV3|nr:hypothetical protein TVAGG3_0487540 [Trichomonas vaginalis G3]EAX99425.1 hypothetical protein TVAG_408340 [Trichomonas vaginalis G3]KAI5516140.1 hypothetical protein TVAGG3_0487540 [Trichomonas vaginalis G3]|eukprot:XP_001312355.1 hypothetical protein [Trichomonas vaginalis G3]